MEAEFNGMRSPKVGMIFVFAEKPKMRRTMKRETLLMANGIARNAIPQRLNAEIVRSHGARVAIGLGKNGVVRNAVKLRAYARYADYAINR